MAPKWAEKGSRCNSGTDPPLCVGTNAAIATVTFGALIEMSREGAVSRRIHESEDLPIRSRKYLVEMVNPQADIIGLGFFYGPR